MRSRFTGLLRQFCRLSVWLSSGNRLYRQKRGEILGYAMILPKLLGNACGIASVLLMLCGAAAKAKEPADADTPPAGAEAAPDIVKKDPKTGDITVEEQGVASWYGRTWRGRRTASGTRFDDRALTAAHLWLPFATRARVTNMQNGRSVDVVVTDRGPYHDGRIIDLSAKAAELLGMTRNGTAEVLITAQL
jgi:rare lipoprotein A